MQKPALYTAAVIFLLVAVAHWLRLAYDTYVVIGGTVIPQWVSLLAGVVTVVLAAWMFVAARPR